MILAVLAVVTLARSVRIVRPYEAGLKVVMGKYVGKLMPGLNIVAPFVTRVVKMDMRDHSLDVPHRWALTKDKYPLKVGATLVMRVVDAERAHFQVEDQKKAVVDLVATRLSESISRLDLADAMEMRRSPGPEFMDRLLEATDPWGVVVERVRIHELDPGPEALLELRRRSALEERGSGDEGEGSLGAPQAPGDQPVSGAGRAEAIRKARESLDFLPRGLPEHLWDWDEEELVRAIVDGERDRTPDGVPLVRIDGRWFVYAPEEMAIHMMEWEEGRGADGRGGEGR